MTDVNVDDITAFLDEQHKKEKESSKNVAQYVEEEKYADGK